MATTEDGKERCALHDLAYPTGGSCSRCDAIRQNAIAVVEIPEDSVAIDNEIKQDIVADLALARYLLRVSKERIEDGNPNDWAAAAKLIAEGTKLKRHALELKEKLSARAHSRYLVEHEKRVRGLQRRKGN